MILTMRDISKKNKILTIIRIRKSSINEKIFKEVIKDFSCNCGYSNCSCNKGYFIYQDENRLNINYLSMARVAKTEIYFNEFKKEYCKRMGVKN